MGKGIQKVFEFGFQKEWEWEKAFEKSLNVVFRRSGNPDTGIRSLEKCFSVLGKTCFAVYFHCVICGTECLLAYHLTGYSRTHQTSVFRLSLYAVWLLGCVLYMDLYDIFEVKPLYITIVLFVLADTEAGNTGKFLQSSICRRLTAFC